MALKGTISPAFWRERAQYIIERMIRLALTNKCKIHPWMNKG
jgi:hypothetical protein